MEGHPNIQRHKALSQSSDELKSGMSESLNNGKRESSCHHDNYLWFGSKGNGGPNNVYPGDLFHSLETSFLDYLTRKPLFLIIESDNSHAFKAGLSKLVRVSWKLSDGAFLYFL